MAKPIELGFQPSPQQRRVWRMQDDGLTTCATLCALRIEGNLDKGALRQALAETVTRHEILRTAFRLPAGLTVPLQVILEPGPVNIPEVDFRDLSPESRSAGATDLFYTLGRLPFDLERGEVWRAVLVWISPCEHELVVATSAACADAGAFEPLAADFLAAYTRQRSGGAEDLEPPLQYVDVAEWQNSLLERGDTTEGLETWRELWREHEIDARITLPLPLEDGEAAPGPFAPREVPLPITCETAAALAHLARARGCSLQVLVLTAWMAVIHRGTSRDETLVGMLYPGRDAEELRGVIGPLARYLPIATHFSPEALVWEAVARIGQAIAEAEAWGDYFSWDHVTRNGAGGFPVCFEATVEAWKLAVDGLRVFPVQPGKNISILDSFSLALSCSGSGSGESLQLTLRYDPRRFRREAANRLAGRLAALLRSIAARPDAPLADHPSMAEEELNRWMELSIAPPAADSGREGKTLHEVFEEQANLTPDRLAVVASDGRLTFRDLDVQANRLAHHLRAAGAGPEVPVALCLDRSAEAVVALLAVWKAGAAYVPLDPAQPVERLAQILEDAGAPLLVTHARLAFGLPDKKRLPGLRTMRLDEEAAAIAQRPVDRPASGVGPRNLAYVIYTSGSTGRPKGVQVEHRSALHLLTALEAAVLGPLADSGLRPDPLLASLNAPMIFDASVQQLVLLLAGHALCVVPADIRSDGAALLSFLREQEVDLLDCTPSQLRLLVNEGLLDGPARPHIVLTAGEAVDEPLWKHLAGAERTVCFNLYGPTECSVNATFHRIEPGSAKPVIGRPLAGYEAFLVDRSLQPVPLGAPGEICLGGTCLARGYLHRPDMTSERFVPHPFARRPGERLYRTGDLARHLPSGDLEFLGRLDHQVKIRGFRIELREIEAVLATLPGVRETVVVARSDRSDGSPGDRWLVAYVVGDSAVSSEQTLRRALREQLPEYMVPAAFVMLKALPLTPNGKVDRKELPAPERQDDEETYLAPRTPVEEILAGIWAEVLGLERVGAADHFFDLGGHSLLATRVMSRLRAALCVEMPLRDLFAAPRLADLASRVEAIQRAGTGLLAPPLVPMPRQGALPLSFAQQRLWFIAQLEPDSPLYNIPVALRVEGPLEPGVLALCLGEIVRRHEALRTVFEAPEGLPLQVIQPAEPFVLSVVDLSGLAAREREAAAFRLTGEEAGRPFDLARGPLLRCMLLRLAEHDFVVTLTMHHIVSDGWSMGNLVREVVALHAAFAQGRPSPLPELPVQYADFAVWQHSWLHGEVLEGEISFWRRQLADLPPRLELPTDRPRPAVQSFRGASRPVRLSAELTRQLQALGRREGATLFMVLLAGFQALLARYSGQNDLAVGTPIAGRNRVEIEGLIGFFVNTLVLRGDLTGEPAFRELLGRVRETTLAANLHQDVPFERLVEELAPERNLAHPPLFQVILALQNIPAESLEIQDLHLRPVDLEGTTAKFDLALSLAEHRGVIGGGIEYATDLFDGTTIDRMIGSFERMLSSATTWAERQVAELPLLTEAERHQLQAEWNDTAVPTTPGVVELFEAQAHHSPDAIAVVLTGDEDKGLTYRELDRRADLLAGRLRALGVGPEVPVGLCVEQTPELAVAVLGIFKSGGALLALDPTHPPARLSFLLADAAVSVLVSQSHLLPSLPLHGARTVLLEGEEPTVERMANGAGPGPGDPAYLIYTSGTTGQPKAVLVEHGMLAATLAATRKLFHFAAGDRMPCLALSTFDISLFELLSPLLTGGTAVLFPLRPALDVELVVDHLREMTCLHAVPALMRGIIESFRRRGAAAPDVTRIRAVFVGGDTVPARLLEDLREIFLAARVWILYGPTEGTIVCAAHPVPPPPASARPLLGRPLAGAALDVRDPNGKLLPVGVPGELWIGGAGVTRGYLGRDALTAEKYVLRDGERFYRSGDRVRRLADGTLEFLGRLDHQVKVRGFRIELGEIEAALREHGAVQEAVVDLEEHAGDRRLIAWVVPLAAQDGAGQGPLELWPSIGEYPVYDELIYHGLTHDAPRNELYLRALRRVAAGKVVVDVGAGRDAILARLCIEAGARRVYAIEISDESCRHARELIVSLGLENRVEVIQGDVLTARLPEKADVCVSEIVEAIGGAEGAAVLLDAARRFLGPGGVMVPGRSVTRIAAITLPDEIDAEPCFTEAAAHYVQRIFEAVGHPFDLRLCIKGFPPSLLLSDAGIFEDLDFTRPVPAQYERELVLTMNKAGRLDGLLVWLELYLEGEILDILEGRYSWFPVYFPVFHPGLQVTAGDTIRALCKGRLSDDGVHPDYFLAGHLVRQSGESPAINVDSSHHPVHFGATPFYRHLFRDGEIPVRRGSDAASLSHSLRAHLTKRLPEYMLPATFVTVAMLPLTPNGKVDRKALPTPDWQGADEGCQAPRTPVEEILAGIWAEVLGLERVAADDHFFDLGGHSLLAMQVVSRLRSAFGLEMPLRDLFEAPRLADLAARIEAALRAGAHQQTPPLVPVPREGPLLLSFAQQRLWFIDQLEPGSTLYNMPVALRVEGLLDGDVLARALGEIVRRHETLRTVFATVEGSPVQVIRPAAPFVLPVVDLSGLPERVREATALALAGEEAGRPFDLARGPLLRSVLLRLAGGDHAVVLTLHHITGDGWSMGNLVREVTALYAAFAQGKPSSLPELPVQYADFAVWQHSWLQGEVLDREIDFWRRQLEGLPPLLDLPTDRLRPPMLSFRGATWPVRLPVALGPRIQALGRKEGVTLFMVLLAGFQALLARYSGQQDLAVGSPIAGRNRMEIEGLIGFFVNTLVLRGDLAGEPAFRELVGRVRGTALAAYLHQDVPFEKLVEELAPARSLAYTPLFQVMLVLQNVPAESLEIRDLRLRPVSFPGTMARFDLTLALWEQNGEIDGTLDYATDLFDATTAERLASHLLTLLAELAADPERRISEVPLLSAGEHAQLLAAWTGPRLASLWAGPVHELFALSAERDPEAPAMLFEGETISYGALRRRVSSLAAELSAAGVGPEARVALAVDSSPAMITGLLGILEAGGAYVPLDPAAPADRLAHLLADAGVQAVVTQERHRAAFAGCGATVLCLSPSAEPGSRPGAPMPCRRTTFPAGAAYVIYTSGSTGTPKGVVAPHSGLSSFTRAMVDALRLGPGDRVLQFAAITFDASAVQIFPTLASGAALVLHPDPRSLSPVEILDLCRQTGVTVLDLPAALWRQWIAATPREALHGTAIRAYLTGGEAVPVATLREWAAQVAPGATFLSSYGPTETTVTSTAFSTTREKVSGLARSEVPLGHPLPNTRLVLLDRNGQTPPPGVWGEIFIGGAGVTRGYLNQPSLTAESFVPDPLSGEAGARLYRTGDLARILPDGEMEFLGRGDHQVKVRGYRVELGEVEAALATFPGVREAAVTVHDDGAGDRRLMAWVMPEPGAEPTEEHLFAALRKALPSYMVPSRAFLLPELPLTTSGKVDRKALSRRELPRDSRPAGRDAVTPRTVTELILAQMFEELLGVPVGAEDDFFALGGHSLLSVRLVARIRQRFGRDLRLAELFTHSTVAALALRLDAEDGTPSPWSPLVRLHAGGTGRPLFVVHEIGGGVLSYLELARRIGTDRPVYGLQATRPDGSQPTMEDLAAQYVAAVRQVQSEGPCLLAGWSSGAVVAFEMARQIESSGGTVQLLAMIEPSSPPRQGPGEEDGETILLGEFAMMGAAKHRHERIRELLEGLDVDTGLDRLFELGRAEGVLLPELEKPQLRERFEVFRRNVKTLLGYAPRPYGGRVVLFRTESIDPANLQNMPLEHRHELDDPTRGWGAFATGGVEVHTVPGTHSTIVQMPYVETLAEFLRTCLAQAEEGKADLPPATGNG